jgi:hypothetical protein
MNKFTLIRCLIWNAALIVLFSLQTGYCQTDIPAGDVSGTWSLSNSPYQVNGNITIPDGQILTIEPGVTAIFKEACKLDVQGCLIAVGTSEDTITFTAEDPGAGWHAIKFVNTPVSNDTSKIVFCKIEYGKLDQGDWLDRCGGAILSSYVSKLIISNCLLQNNRAYNVGDMYSGSGGAIALDNASPIISNNCIINNESVNHSGGGIMCANNSHPVISNNVIAKNIADYGGGLSITFGSHPIVINNIIVNNQVSHYGGCLRCYQSGKAVLINNTITLNTAQLGGGISCTKNSDPLFINTILYGNTAGSGDQVDLVTVDSDPGFYYCNIEGGTESFKGDGAGLEYSGAYENNINADPCFIDAESDDFSLSEFSHCIGAGIDSIEIGSTWYYAPATDFDGNQRPDPAESGPDIGAFENVLGNQPTNIDEALNQFSKSCTVMQNYPNPFNNVTHIKYQLYKDTRVCIKILNALGQEVESIIDEKKKAGHYSISWDASNNASGLYFISLKTDENYKTRKMLLIR